MREDFLERLDGMFPDGYLILYTLPNNQLRLNLFNPHKDESINSYYHLLKKKGEDSNETK